MTTNVIRRRATEESGFTLVELLVVMIIVSILMVAAMPAFLGNKQKAVATNMKASVSNVSDNIEACAASLTNSSYKEGTTFCGDGAIINGSDKGVGNMLQDTGSTTQTTALSGFTLTPPTVSGKVAPGTICNNAARDACDGYFAAGLVKKGADEVVFLLVKNPNTQETVKSCGSKPASLVIPASYTPTWGTANDLSRQICPSGTW